MEETKVETKSGFMFILRGDRKQQSLERVCPLSSLTTLSPIYRHQAVLTAFLVHCFSLLVMDIAEQQVPSGGTKVMQLISVLLNH